MRTLPLRAGPKYGTRAVVEAVLNQSPQRALTLQDMRVRSKILDKVETLPPDASSVELEDAEYQQLSDACATFPWAVFDRALLRVLEDIDGVKAS